VGRGAYDHLPTLVLTVTASAVVIPLAVIFLLRLCRCQTLRV
jgi:hypothetical protein